MEYLIRTEFFWHLGLAFAGVPLAYLLWKYVISVKNIQFFLSFISILAIGLFYELYQGMQIDTGSDIVADIVGAVLGIVFLIILDKS